MGRKFGFGEEPAQPPAPQQRPQGGPPPGALTGALQGQLQQINQKVDENRSLLEQLGQEAAAYTAQPQDNIFGGGGGGVFSSEPSAPQTFEDQGIKGSKQKNYGDAAPVALDFQFDPGSINLGK